MSPCVDRFVKRLITGAHSNEAGRFHFYYLLPSPECVLVVGKGACCHVNFVVMGTTRLPDR